eukprot:8117357-Ditylum_brightwellii.AAC.1
MAALHRHQPLPSLAPNPSKSTNGAKTCSAGSASAITIAPPHLRTIRSTVLVGKVVGEIWEQ